MLLWATLGQLSLFHIRIRVQVQGQAHRFIFHWPKRSTSWTLTTAYRFLGAPIDLDFGSTTKSNHGCSQQTPPCETGVQDLRGWEWRPEAHQKENHPSAPHRGQMGHVILLKLATSKTLSLCTFVETHTYFRISSLYWYKQKAIP